MSNPRRLETLANNAVAPNNLTNITIPSALGSITAPTTTASTTISVLTAASASPIARQESASSIGSASPSMPSTPAGTPKAISLTGNQGFIFSLHQSRTNSNYLKFIQTITSHYAINMVHDLNSAAAVLGYIDKLGPDYSASLINEAKKNGTNFSLTNHTPINNFSSDLTKAGLNEKTNVVLEILEKVRELTKKDVTTINYFGDFNTGCSGENVTHMETLIATLKSEEFTKSNNGVTVRFETEEKKHNSQTASPTERAPKEIVFRAFMDGSGGSDNTLLPPNSIYTNMSHVKAKKDYSYNGFIAVFAMKKIEMTMQASARRASTTSPFITSSAPMTPSTPVSRGFALPPHPGAILPAANLITPTSASQRSFFSPASPADSSTLTWPPLASFVNAPIDLEILQEMGPKVPHTTPERPSPEDDEATHRRRNNLTQVGLSPLMSRLQLFSEQPELTKESGSSFQPYSNNKTNAL